MLIPTKQRNLEESSQGAEMIPITKCTNEFHKSCEVDIYKKLQLVSSP